MNRTVSNRRLLKLAAFLDSLDEERFDYRYWIGNDWKGKPDLSCGTTACAVGWATTIPSFRRAGLRMGDDEPLLLRAGRLTLSSWPAVCEFFGVREHVAQYLFLPSSALWTTNDDVALVNGEHLRAPAAAARPSDVAEHIRDFVARRDLIEARSRASR